MRHLIAGTAGHIDHGKTALVRALTGTDTDRLEEEKRRGISIDLGFAHLNLADGLRLGFVDVPGHERFVKNMLAGASGIDLVLLVVSAGEGIMPQTREHFEICRLLGVSRGVVALTKADLVTEDGLDLARLELEEFLKGTFLEKAPVVPVSATTGAGLEELRGALELVAREAQEKDDSRLARLPIDRSFAMRGHGAVVTGTLVSGTIGSGEEMELYPSNRRARVRGVQVHGAKTDRAHAGERTAVNLAGIEAADACRGMTLAPAGVFEVTQQVDASFELLSTAQPLKHRAPVHFHSGTAEVEAQARLVTTLDPVQPGARALVRFILREPLLILPGDRFIVRMFSPVVTIGGGTVLDIAAPARERRPDLARRLEVLSRGSSSAHLAFLAADHGTSVKAAVARTGLGPEQIRALVSASSEFTFFESHDWIASAAWADGKREHIRQAVAVFHQENPLRPGIGKEALRAKVLPAAPNSLPARSFLLDALLAGATDLVSEQEVVRLATHKIALQSTESAAAEKMERLFQQSGLAVPSLAEVLSKAGVDTARARTLLQILLRERKLVRVSAELVYHASAIEALKATLAKNKGRRFSVADFKEWTGVSRKYAIPLLEFLDRERVTRREGDARVVL